MIENNRYVILEENGKTIGMLSFSLCDNPEPYLNNLEHKYIEHNINGKILVLENFVGVRFGYKTIGLLEEFFYSKFPQIEKTMWRRCKLPKDKIFTYNRRYAYAI